MNTERLIDCDNSITAIPAVAGSIRKTHRARFRRVDRIATDFSGNRDVVARFRFPVERIISTQDLGAVGNTLIAALAVAGTYGLDAAVGHRSNQVAFPDELGYFRRRGIIHLHESGVGRSGFAIGKHHASLE